MIVMKTSMFTGKTNSMDLDITREQWAKWKDGMLIQDAMPNLTADEREFMISGVTPEEWSQLFG